MTAVNRRLALILNTSRSKLLFEFARFHNKTHFFKNHVIFTKLSCSIFAFNC